MIKRRHVMGTKDNGPIEYLRFTALENGTFSLTIPSQLDPTSFVEYVEYSIDEGITWVHTDNTTSDVVITTPTITSGNSVLWRGRSPYVNKRFVFCQNTYNSTFSSTGKFNASGWLITLSNPNAHSPQGYIADYGAKNLFKNSKIVDASNLCLPFTPSSRLYQSYTGFFLNCSYLTTPPILSTTTLGQQCFSSMFEGCSALTQAPELPAVDLTGANNCYSFMFRYCSSLTNAPELPATTLARSCYYYMFCDCTSLVNAPELPATTLDVACYEYMFRGCTSLTTAPELPATTVTQECYYGMFRGCTKLTTAPILPATTLAYYSYREMFYQCSKLNFIKCLATTFNSNQCNGWTYQVASSGTFVKDANATWTTGTSGIPTSWVQIDSRPCLLVEDTIVTGKSETIQNVKALLDADHYSIVNNNNWFTITATGSTQVNIAVTISENNTGSDRTGTFTINCYDENNNLLDTGTVTVTQYAIAAAYSVNLNNGQWVWDSSLNCYKSDSNYHVTNGSASMSIEISGYTEFTIKVRTYGEKNYDYLTVGKLDQIPTRSNSTSGTNYWTGFGKSSATTWYDVTFSNIDGGAHTINLLYAKDGSTNTYDDRAYMQIITK